MYDYKVLQFPEVNNQQQEDNERGILDRVFSLVGNESITSALYNATDDDPNTTFAQGLGAGVKKMNPFEDDVSDSHTFSDILTDNVGWNPDTLIGKALKGVAGFAGDVLLDPLTYLTGGLGAVSKVVKGTGKVVKGIDTVADAAKAVDAVATGDKFVKTGDILSDLDKAANASKVSNDVKNIGKVDLEKGVGNLPLLDYETARKIEESTAKGKFSTFKVNPELLNQGVSEAKQLENFIDDNTRNLVASFNKKVMGVYDEARIAKEKGLEVGFGYVPWASKVKIGDRQLDSFKKTLLSSEQLRNFGDKTIAPYYNKLARDIKTSKIGQKFDKFSDINKILGEQGTEAAAKLFKVKNMATKSDFRKAKLNAEVYKQREVMQDIYDKINADGKWNLNDINDYYENGIMEQAMKLHEISLKIKSQYGKSIGDLEASNVADEELNKLLKKAKQIKSNKHAYTVGEIPTSAAKQYDILYKKLDDLLNDAYASTKEFKELPEDMQKKILTLEHKLDEVKEQVEKEGYGNIGVIDKKIKLNKAEQRTVQSLADDDDVMKLANMVRQRMDIVGRKEVQAGLLDELSYEARKTTYLPHSFTEEAKQAINNGEFNPEIMPQGYSEVFAKGTKSHNRHRQLEGTISEINKRVKESETGGFVAKDGGEVVDKLFNDSIVDIVVERELLSNKLLTSKETGNFLKKNIFKSSESKFNNVQVFEWNDVNDYCNNLIGRACFNTGYKLNSEEFQAVKNKFLLNLGMFKEGDNSIEKLSSNQPIIKVNEVDDYAAYVVTSNLATNKQSKKYITECLIDAFDYVDKEISDGIENLVGKAEGIHVPMFYTNDYVINNVNIASFMQEQANKKKFVAVYDKLLNMWKKNKTIYNPTFMPQNAIGNQVQSWLANVDTLNNPQMQKKAFDILTSKDPRATVKLNNTKYTYRQLYDMANDYGVLENTFTQEMLGDTTGSALDGIKGKINKLETKLTNASINVESHSRLSLFMNEINAGKTPQEAAESVTQFLFDYSDLTDFEKKIMREVFPFYSWLKKNSSLQFNQLMEQSYKYALIDKATNAADEALSENTNDDYDGYNNVGIGNNENINLGLPTDQFRKLTPKSLTLQSSPVIQLALKGITGKQIYNGKDIENAPADVFETFAPQILVDMLK